MPLVIKPIVCSVSAQLKEKPMRNIYPICLAVVFILAHTTNLVAQDNMLTKTEIVIKSKYGSADGEFGLKTFEDRSWAEPTAITIDSKGSIYIADPLNNRIQKFDKDGKFLFKISLDIQKQRFAMTIDDLAVDQEDNLYAVSRHEQKIFKYNQNGTLVQTINLKPMEIAWISWRGWSAGGYFQPRRLTVDVIGNLYIEGFNELIKFNKNGTLSKKWAIESGAASHFVDQNGYLYFSKKIGEWVKYDQKGNLLGQVVCEKEPLLAFIPPVEGRCQFPPKFIDKNGFRYYFELKEKTSDLVAILKVDRKGGFKKYKAPPVDIWQTPNMIKFDSKGNLYGYDYDDKKQEYWIMRISLN